jgi:peptidoglycan/LPS O-acetylase OafA/YrhL
MVSTSSVGGADSHAIRYRADIDGLRAIAVLSVVGFHLSRQNLPGGYLGVDMFFVLSGYLITAIIWREIQDGRFSVGRFYDRRIRRIMPALLLLLIVTTVASVLLLLPSDLIGYCRSLLATLIFSANVYFWRDTNYFSAAAEQKPLLHIWSLGVEEQFYLFFPIVLLVVARWWRHRALLCVATLSIISFAANLLAIYFGAGVPAFFLLPTRAWELGLGAILALLPTEATPRGRTASGMAWLGAASIIIVMLYPLDADGPVPAAVPAVIGTALLIVAAARARPLVNRLLELRPVVFVGLISYSLYLWHWPIIVFGQYYLVRPYTPPEMLASIALMLACATVTWWFIERPFRERAISMNRVRLAASIGVGCLSIMAAALIADKGMPNRLNAEAAVINQAVDTNYRCPIPNYLTFGSSRACVMNLPSRDPNNADVILLGNSHAQMYEPVWASILAARGESGLLVPVNGCLPTVSVNVNRDCLALARRNLTEILTLRRAHTIILGLNWQHGVHELVDSSGALVDNSDDRGLASALDDLIDRLRRDGKDVILIGPIAEPGWDVASILSRDLAFGHAVDHPTSIPAVEFEARFGSLIRHFEARHDISFARPDRVQCPRDRCYFVLDGRTLFSDSNHIASAELPRFRAVFEAVLSQSRKSITLSSNGAP